MRHRVALAVIEDCGSDAAAAGIGVDEERADLRAVPARVQLRRITVGTRVSAEERSTSTPTTATDQSAIVFDDEERSVLNQLRVDTERTAQRALYLSAAVVTHTQRPRRKRNESLQVTDVVVGCLAKDVTGREHRV